MAIFFVVTIYFVDGSDDAWKIGIGMIFILALIWFGDEMGSYIGPTSRGSITATTPGWMLRGFGWIILTGAFVLSVFQIIAIVKN